MVLYNGLNAAALCVVFSVLTALMLILSNVLENACAWSSPGGLYFTDASIVSHLFVGPRCFFKLQCCLSAISSANPLTKPIYTEATSYSSWLQ